MDQMDLLRPACCADLAWKRGGRAHARASRGAALDLMCDFSIGIQAPSFRKTVFFGTAPWNSSAEGRSSRRAKKARTATDARSTRD